MNCVEPDRCIPNSRRNPFGVILPAVNADYCELAAVFRFELPQLREYVDAVDSPIGPEVQKNDFPAQVGELEFFPACMNPVEVVGKLRRPD